MKIIKTIALIFFFCTINIVLYAQQPIYTQIGLEQSYIGKSLHLYQDSTGRLSFDQIRKLGNQFKPNSVDVPNFGISSNNNWIRFTLINNLNIEKVILNLSNPIIDKADLYIVRNQRIDSVHYNNYEPLRHRIYKHQFYLFDIPIKRGDTVECYLNLKSNQQILAPLSLIGEKQLVTTISNSDTRAGLYLGIMLVMLLYNLFIFFTVRDKDYLVYCHYIFWVTITQATLLGYSHRFLWTENLWLSHNMLILCGAMSGIATILFAKSFLHTKQYIPKLNIVLTVTIVIYLASILVLLLGYPIVAFQMVNVNAALVSLLIIYVAWTVYRKKYAPARYFLLAWSIFFISILVFVFKDYGIVPYNQLTVHAVEIGSALEAVFLSFALAGKINILKKEKEASNRETLAVLQENDRIIREQNEVLEAKVHERTVELIASNDELHKTLIDLKEAESQLVESEKMASLGQLTAGIAHEINNPINFVTSNVGPLKRDVEILLDMIDTMEVVGLADNPIQKKRDQIENYKLDIDFDYLKIEIDSLLKGIGDGASRTAEIIKGLRIFSRLDEDDLKFADINEGLESTLILVNNLINNSKISVIRNFADIPQIECYPGKLNQVFLNIISNAIYAVNKNSHNFSQGILRLTTEVQGDSLLIKIEDNGIGMDDNTMKKIFEPFFTTKDVGEGTGLGMSITYNTIKRHNGSVHINSTVGVGTEFILQIPLLQKAGANPQVTHI